jgi:uncharacterized protein (TIGR00251 family)
MNFTETKDGTVIEVYVKPNSPKFGISVEEGEVVVRATEEPERGKVNKEILKELTKLFHAPVELVSGATSRQKRFLVKGVKASEVECLLNKENAV